VHHLLGSLGSKMCLAIPGKVKKIEDKHALVDFEGHTHKIITVLIPKLKVGDWVMAHDDLGINKLPEEDALEIIRLASSCHHKH